MSDMNVSIAMATYNGAKYVRQQLLSIAQQSFLPSELVVSDDGSSDETLEVVREFARSAPFVVKILRNPTNIGYTQNFGIALSHCTGGIVFLSDQDDCWLPNKIEVMLGYFAVESRIDLLIHDLEYCKEDLTPTGQTKIQRLQGVVEVNRNYVVGMATAMRTGFLKHCLPIPNVPGMAHDVWLHTCASALGRKRVIPEVLALYRRHSSNATISLSVNSCEPISRWSLWLAMIRVDKNLQPQDADESSALERWLIDKRALLVAEGYATTAEINEAGTREAERRLIMKQRRMIWRLPRQSRVLPVSLLLATGKYKRFSGWKTAVRDLISE